MIPTIEVFKTIASLCMIMAGDNPSMDNMANIIEWKQVDCHSYYAECTKKSSLAECMIARPKYLNDKLKREIESYKRAK